jgi:hypothetical protein
VGRGGKRDGAGRPRGSGDKNLQLVRAALKANEAKILNRSIRLALKKEPCIPVLLKLVDKLLPSLHSQAIKAEVQSEPGFGISQEEMTRIMDLHDRDVIERYKKGLIDVPETEKPPSEVSNLPPIGPRPERQPR